MITSREENLVRSIDFNAEAVNKSDCHCDVRWDHENAGWLDSEEVFNVSYSCE